MDLSVVVGDGLLALGAVTAAVVGQRAITATRAVASEARDHARDALDVGERNNAHLLALADESMTDRIRAAVAAYAAEHPHVVGEAVMFDAMRDLFDAIIAANLDPDDATPYPGRARRLRAARLPADDDLRR